MKAVIFFVLTFVVSAVAGQVKTGTFTPFVVDKTVRAVLAKAKAKVKAKFSYPMTDDGFWIFMDEKGTMGFSDGKTSPLIYLDTAQQFIVAPCDCMIKKDTIYLQGGIAYGAGMGFDVKIVNNLFDSKIWMAGNEYRKSEQADFREEIVLNSATQRLTIHSKASLRLGSTLIGELITESEPYYQNGEQGPNKMYIKLLFRCKLDSGIAF